MMPSRFRRTITLEMAVKPRESGLGSCFMTTKVLETSGVQAVEEKAGLSLSSRNHCSLEAMV